MAGILLGILLLLAALVFAVRIKEIKVTGNSHYTEEQVIDLVLCIVDRKSTRLNSSHH